MNGGHVESLLFFGGFAAITLQPTGVVDIVAFETSPVFRAGHKILGGLGLIAALTSLAPLIIREGAAGTQPVHGGRGPAARAALPAFTLLPGSGAGTVWLLIQRLLLASPGLHT
jgi:hypothetical protein